MTIVNYMTSFYNKFMISYAPLWETLKRKKISTYTLIQRYGISSATIDRMKKGNGISTAKIDDLCRILDCSVQEIIVYVKEQADG